jgi:hypothetical protein
VSERVEELRRALLLVHRAILDAERADHERRHGAVGGPEFLRLLLNDLRYDWLRPLSELVIQFDETQAEAAKEGEPIPDERVDVLVDVARELLLPPKPGVAFGRRYADLLQREPDVVMAHAGLVQTLRDG